MSSKIEWTDETWNPIRARRKDNGKVGTHCEKVSPACLYCYADQRSQNERNLPHGATGLEYSRASRDLVEIILDPEHLAKPLHWQRPRKIFPCSMTDLFGQFVPDMYIAELWRMMQRTRRHTYQILTKRADRMAHLMPSLVETFGVLPNVLLGVTAEDQLRANERVPQLLKCEAAGHFVSYEPALGPIDLDPWLYPAEIILCPTCEREHIDGEADRHTYYPHYKHLCHYCCFLFDNSVRSWGAVDARPALSGVIAGGESGRRARPSHPDWFSSVRDQCNAASVPFFFKQWGEFLPEDTPDAKGLHWQAGHSDPRVHRFDDGVAVIRIGKKNAGRKLDGRIWNEFPEVRCGL